MTEEQSLEEMLEGVEAMERDFRLGKISEEEVAEYMKDLAKKLDIPIEPE